MKRWGLLVWLLIIIFLLSGCIEHKNRPVAWELEGVSGQATELEEGTRVYHHVTVKNAGYTDAHNVSVSFRFATLKTYGDETDLLKPGQSFTVSDPSSSNVLKAFDFDRYQQDYEGDGTVIIKWQENGVQKSQYIAYTGKYHPQEPEPDLPSKTARHGPIPPTISPTMDNIIMNQGAELWLFSINGEAIKKIWTCPEGCWLSQSYVKWADNGEKVIFATDSYPDDDYNNIRQAVWLYDLQQQSACEILECDARVEVNWSADADKVLLEYGFFDSKVKKWKDCLLLHDCQSGKTLPLIGGDDTRNIVSPLWTADSTGFAYAALLDNSTSILAMYDLKDESVQVITEQGEPCFPRYLSIDGKRLYYQTGNYGGVDMGQHQLGYFDLDTLQDHRLTQSDIHGPNNRFMSISPDEKTLLFCQDKEQGLGSELWSMDIASKTVQKVSDGDYFRSFIWLENSSDFIYSVRNSKEGDCFYIRKSSAADEGSIDLVKDYCWLYPQWLKNGEVYFSQKLTNNSSGQYSLKALNLFDGQVRDIIEGDESI